MPNRFAAFGWSLDLAPGWSAEIRQESSFGETTAFLAIVPKANDALLRLTPDDRGIMAASEWVETVGRINRLKGRALSAIQCAGLGSGSFGVLLRRPVELTRKINGPRVPPPPATAEV
jgi:hypothetical protein